LSGELQFVACRKVEGRWDCAVVEYLRLGAKSSAVKMLGLRGYIPQCLNAVVMREGTIASE
jgi:hypothetical protein